MSDLSDEVEEFEASVPEPIDLTGSEVKSHSEEQINEDAVISITGCLTNDKDGEIIQVDSPDTDSIEEPPKDDWQPPPEPDDPLAPRVVEDAYETCGVCLDPWGYDDNQILYCDGCDLPVHQHCYGVREIPEGDWYCQACRAHLKLLNGGKGDEIKPKKKDWWGSTNECCLCESNPKKIKWALSEVAGRRGDKLKRFCHVLCAQFVSETWFKDAANCSKVANVDNVQPRRSYGTCSFCGDTDGVKVLCSLKSCTTCFHAPCGLAWGCKLEDVAPLTETYSNRVVYCIAHRPIVIEAGKNARLKHELKQSQNIKLEANRNALGWNWKSTDDSKKKRGRPVQKKEEEPVVHSRPKTREVKKKKKRLIAQIHSESDTESDVVLPEVDAEVMSQPFRTVKTRSSGPVSEPLSIRAARKFAPHTREPTHKKKKAQKRKREHEIPEKSRKKSIHAARKSAISIPKRSAAGGLPNNNQGRLKLAEFEQKELARLSKKSQIRDTLPKHLLPSVRKKQQPILHSLEPPPLEPQDGERKKAKLVSSFGRHPRIRDRTKSRIRPDPRTSRDASGRDPRRDRDRRDRSDRDRNRHRDRDRDRRSPKITTTVVEPPPRPATKRPPIPQRPPSTIPVTSHRDPRRVDPRNMDPRKVDRKPDPRKVDRKPDPRKVDPRNARAPPPPPPKKYLTPTNIGFAVAATGPIIANQPITSYAIPPPPPGQMMNPIWEGKMCKSPACDSFGIFLKLLAGEEVIKKLALPKDADLKLKGRIKFDTLASYIPAMKKSNRKKIFLVEVHPAGASATTRYNKFCQYYRELRRGAVIDLEKSHGVTMYIMPVIDDLSHESIKSINLNFNCFPPKGVMWGVVVQFPDVLAALKGDIIERHIRAQPSAREMKSRVVKKNSDPRAADPRARATPTQPDDDVLDALRKLQEL